MRLGRARRASTTEYDRGTRAHKTTPSMLRQYELNDRSFCQRVGCSAVAYKLSNCANGSEVLLSGFLSRSSERRSSG